MAASTAMANRHIVSTILELLSDMKYKARRQYGPDQPVEFLEFRPTLVPSILVNRLWADEGTSILWKRYPHLPALKGMSLERRQYYANKVRQIFSLSPPPGHPESLDYLDGLEWPNLKSLELEIDFQRHGSKFAKMLHPRLESLELSGSQTGGSKCFVEDILPTLFLSCERLQTIHIGPDTLGEDDPLHVSALYDYLDARPSINVIKIKSTNFADKDTLFTRLSQRPGLRELEIDLDPGYQMLPLLRGPNALPSPFTSLSSLYIMCYPEIALALPSHLNSVENLQFDIARIPHQPAQDPDYTFLGDLIAQVSHCPRLRFFKVNIGLLAQGFPSFSSFPRLSGSSLLQLAGSCPMLEDLNLLATEPSAIDGSSISNEQFDIFCQAVPQLRNLHLKLHPTTTEMLQATALQSLGKHCKELEVVRLKIPYQLSSLPVPDAIPQITISTDVTPMHSPFEELASMDHQKPGDLKSSSSVNSSFVEVTPTSNQSPVPPLFPRLVHLALSRPETPLASTADTFTADSSSHSASEIVDPDLEEDLVRSWAHSLATHFPRIEILEAWGDWTGRDNESLNYFLPTEEILASTWEFLSGIEQDLWEDDEELEEDDSWQTLDSGEDWDKASLLNEHPVLEDDIGKLSLYDEEPEGMITPGRIVDEDDLFRDSNKHAAGV